jgi:hypothetical protein
VLLFLKIMNYKVRRQGVDLGIFSLDELRRRRDADEFSGDEYVQREGMADWQPLDLVLQQGYRVMPPPLPSSVFGGEPNHAVISGIVVLGIILFGVVISLFVNNVRKGYLSVASRQQNLEPARSRAATVASRSVSWTTNTLTQVDASRREREFRIRQWLEGYETRGQRNSASDEEVEQFIRVWIARNYGGADATNELSLAAESDRLANNPECTDPLVLTVAAGESPNRSDSTIRFERALAAYPQSRHRAYPKFYAMVLRGDQTADRSTALDNSALQEFQKCFADGSFTPADQQEIGEIFVNGWGADFFHRHADSICAITRTSGPDYQWLALVLDGENHIQQAWLARGNGYANTVTEQGWQGFREHLKDARKSLEQAWKLQPGFPARTLPNDDRGAGRFRRHRGDAHLV